MNSLSDLNTYSSTSVDYTDQTAGNLTLDNRFSINGVIGTDANVLQNLEKICNAAGAWLTYDIHQGKWAVIINRHSVDDVARADTEQYSFNDSNIIGPISVSSTGLDNLYNAVKVSYPRDDLQNQTDFIQIEIPTEDRYPNEEYNVLDLNYGIVTNPVQAQLLGFIELKQSRLDKIVKFQTDYSKISIKAGDIISVTNDVYGFNHKKFRVITVGEVDADDGNLNIEITALEYDASVYDESNLTKYTRTNQNGIATLGNIFAPATPTITKYEVDARPRVDITTSISGGIADTVEFWYTSDVPPTYTVESSRTYTLLTTQKPTAGNVFPLNSNITVEADNLNSGSFLVKARALNGQAASPFSDPSGFVYTPVQTTNNVDNNTTISNGLNLTTLLEMAALSFAINNGTSILANVLGNAGSTLSNTISTFFANTGTLGNVISNVFSTGSDSNVSTSTGNVIINNPPLTAGDGVTVSGGTVSLSSLGTSVNLKGHIFPSLFGSNVYAGLNDTRAGVFTHQHLTFGSGTAKSVAAQPITSGSKTFTINYSAGDYPGFMNADATYSRYKWKVVARTPYYAGGYVYYLSANTAVGGGLTKNTNWSGLTDPSQPSPRGIYTYPNGEVNIYYTTATYDSNLSLSEQNWGAWKKLASTNGVSTTIINGTTNEYKVSIDGYNPSGCSNEPNLGNRPISSITVPPNGLIAFGLSSYDLQNIDFAFSGNTIFGSKVSNTVTSYTFPGYTPVSGQTANIQTQFFNLCDSWSPSDLSSYTRTAPTGSITLSSNVTFVSNTLISVGAVWPDNFTIPQGNTAWKFPISLGGTSMTSLVGIAYCPTININS